MYNRSMFLPGPGYSIASKSFSAPVSIHTDRQAYQHIAETPVTPVNASNNAVLGRGIDESRAVQ